MVLAHLPGWSFPGASLTSGYASALFAILAGVSLAIIMERPNRSGGAELNQAKHRALLRGVILLVIGVALSSLQMSIMVVLSAIAWIFLLLPPVTRWRTRSVVVLLAGLVIVGSLVTVTITAFGAINETVSGTYPMLAWLAYGTAGILVHRLLLHRVWLQLASAIIGIVAALATYEQRYGAPLGGSADSSFAGTQFKDGMEEFATFDYLAFEPHSGALGDVTVSLLFGIGLIGLCLLLCRAEWMRVILYPLRAAGSMSLTIYVAHALTAGWLLIFVAPFSMGGGAEDVPVDMPWDTYQHKVAEAKGYDEFWESESVWWEEQLGGDSGDAGTGGDAISASMDRSYKTMSLITLVAALLFASVWKRFFRRGPMEAGVNRLIRRGTSALPCTGDGAAR